MAQVYSIDGVAVNNRIRTTASPSGVDGLPSSAWYGEAMIAGVTVDDPDGELDLMGWHTFTHDETDCTGSERTFTGWITGKDIMRGDGRQKDGPARIWVCEIIDQNAVWKLKLFRASTAKRPAETDNARMAFMLASSPMAATPVADNGRWNTTDNPTNFGASDYVTQYPIDLANSVAGVSGKNFYAYWDDSAGEISGHYDLVTENPASTIAISNVIADQDATTVYPLLDATLTRSPEDQVNGVLYGYQGGQYVYAQDADLFGAGEFSPVNFDRDVLYTTDRVGLLATAESQAAAQLAARSTEKDTLTVTVLLPPAIVNKLHAGMKVNGKFTHLPGYESGVDLAVIRRNVIPPVVVGGDYTVRLELSNMVAGTGPGSGPGEPPGGGPYVGECDVPGTAEIIQDSYDQTTGVGGGPYTYTGTWDATPQQGHLLIAAFVFRNMTSTTPIAGATLSGWTLQESGAIVGTGGNASCVALYTKIAVAGESTSVVLTNVTTSVTAMVMLQEWTGVDTVASSEVMIQDSSTASGQGLIQLHPPDDTDVVLVGVISTHGGFCDGPLFDTIEDFCGDFGGADPPHFIGHKVITNAQEPEVDLGDNYIVNGFGAGVKWVSAGVVLTCAGSNVPPPQAGMHVKNEFVAEGDGTTTSFTTRFPYIARSLEVFVDGVPIINGVTEVDPSARTFSLDFAAQGASGDTRAERVTVNYQVGAGP